MEEKEIPVPGVHMRGPTSTSNWVIPNKFIGGAYPGDKSDEKHERRIKKILSAGVTLFVCLQKEKELLRFNPYQEIAKKLKPTVEFIHFPISDQYIAKDEEVLNLIETLSEKMKEGHVIYTHCWGGHGRTGTIVACLLAKEFGLDSEKALEMTAAFHKCRTANRKSNSPQHPTQFEQVRRLSPLLSHSSQ